MRTSSSPLKIIVSIILIVAFILFLAWIALLTYGKLAYDDTFSRRTTITSNPGLKDGLVPQGLTWHQENKVFLTTGYMADGSPSRIYQIDPDTGAVQFHPLTSGGQPFYGHTGGLQYAAGSLYLADDGSGLYKFSGRLPAPGEPIEIGTPIQVHNNTAFVFASGGFVYTGEFNNDKEYVTHNPFSYNDTYHSAIVTKYRSSNLAIPELIYSIGNEIQGFAILTDGTIVLSQSYGLAPSRFLIYEPAQQTMTGRTMHGAEVCFLGEPTRIIQAPPMSEDLDVRNGTLVYMTESASKKYLFGNLYFDWNIYELKVN
ncbi:MAG: hypothetical protein IJC31_09940 [Spirochaetaceae bacterium]|nr:hypothetical protein [Spirochaetaceae bacterium]